MYLQKKTFSMHVFIKKKNQYKGKMFSKNIPSIIDLKSKRKNFIKLNILKKIQKF